MPDFALISSSDALDYITSKFMSSEVTEKRPFWSTEPFWPRYLVFSSNVSLLPVNLKRSRVIKLPYTMHQTRQRAHGMMTKTTYE